MSRGARILIALALGGLAALFGMLYLSSERAALLGTAETVRVYVANEDMPANAAIDPERVTVRDVPQTFLQPQAITVQDVPDKGKLRGVTLTEIKQGEQLIRTKIFDGPPPTLASELRARQGMVAVGVDMEALPNTIHGLVRPGDRVDVLASFLFEKGGDEGPFTEIRPLFQNVEIISVNDRTPGNIAILGEEETGGSDAEATIAKTIGLALPPPAAQQIILAQQLGSIWLLLRSPGDTTQYQYEVWNNDRLLQGAYKLWRARDPRAEALRGAAGR
jgi:pilus assembly protein CpaB